MDAPPHVQRVLDRLESVERNGAGWKARCPAHDDQNPSLSIAVGDDGCILVTCHAGCEFPAIARAAGLPQSDFFAPQAAMNGRAERRGRAPRVFETFLDAIAAACPRGHRFVTSWAYKNANGESVFHICRFEPTTPPPEGQKPEKTFRPISRVNGGFVIKDLEGPLPLYRLPEILAAPKDATIYLVEGEKAADALAELGLNSTTTAHGAKSVKKTDLTPLAGRHVVMLPDSDEAGEGYIEKFARRARDLAPQPTLSVLRLPDLPEKGDAVEFIADRRAKGKNDVEIRAEVEGLAAAAPNFTASEDQPKNAVHGSRSSTGVSVDQSNPFTETRNAERLAEHCGADLRFIPKWNKHIAWDGKRWRIDFGDAISLALTKKVLRAIRMEAIACADTNRALAKSLWKWATASESKTGRKAMLDLVRSEAGITIPFERLDADPYLLNVQNGTLELGATSVTIREHRREDLITRIASVSYDPTAICPTFDAYLERILPVPAVRQYLQRVVGMCLTGDVSEQVIVFLVGSGANGKSVFLLVLHALLGSDYALQAKSDLLLKQDHGRGHPTELASLFKKNLVVCTELGAGRKLDEPIVKQLTGGDVINARRMREDEWQFLPSHKIVVACNHMPRIDGQDHGIWRRIAKAPFTVTIPEAEQDKGLVAKLCKELPGILSWAVDGYLLWRRDGLNPPPEVTAATAAYREEQDVLAEFLASECVIHEKSKVSAKDLYAAYTRWCLGAGEEPLKQRTFGTRLTDRGLDKKKTCGVVVYFGIGLKSDATP